MNTGKNLHAVASSLSYHMNNEDDCDPDDITGLPDLQFERDHFPNSNNKIIVSDASSIEVEIGKSIEHGVAEYDSVIKVDKDIVINYNNDNSADTILQAMVNATEKVKVVHIVTATEVTDTEEQVHEIKVNSESFSTKSYSISHCNLGDNIGNNGEDSVVLDFNIVGIVSDAVEGSSPSPTSSISPPPLLSVHTPLETSISSSALMASIASYICFASSTELEHTSTDMILSTDIGGRVIDIPDEIKEPVTLDFVPITETEESPAPTLLPLISIHEEINAANIDPINSDILLVSGVIDNVMTYGDELDALLGLIYS